MRFLLIFTALFALFFLNGCESKKRVVVTKQSLPSWYMHPPKSDENLLYSIGEGKDRQEAVLDALNSMLSTLSISISSSYKAKTVIKEGTHYNSSDATYTNEIESHISAIRISNYEILESKKLGFKRYAVLLRVDKTKLFNALKEELDLEFDSIEEAKKVVQRENPLSELAFYRDALQSFANLKEKLLVMRALSESFEPSLYIQRYERLKKRYELLRRKISFSVTVPKKLKDLKAIIESALISKKYSVKNSKDKMHFQISTHVDIRQSRAYGFILLHTTITIKTEDIYGNIVGANALSIVGQSSTTYDVALHNVVRKFQQIIEKEGISKVLAIDI